jgi:hypothetical protein
VLGREYIVAFTKFLQNIKYIILKFTPTSYFFILPSPIPGIVLMGSLSIQQQ